MKNLEYKIVRDRHNRPLVSLESSLGNGQELYPDGLRGLAAALVKVADEADAKSMGKGYRQEAKSIAL